MSSVKKEYTGNAIYRDSLGPRFGADVIIRNSNENAVARLVYHYSVPPAVQNKRTVLAGTLYFSPDEVEVFYLDPSP